jgi:hypothetical protein
MYTYICIYTYILKKKWRDTAAEKAEHRMADFVSKDNKEESGHMEVLCKQRLLL